ncbi:hypothetical protein ACFYZE_32280 [Streptomyces sp. NPDC001796]|uniref:hypothetical protein n=1 Tax=Streptomyces sp. NPDC001796 TaxID=3364609 RepID=UPI00369C2306
MVWTIEIIHEHVNTSTTAESRHLGRYTCKRTAFTSPECASKRRDNLVILHDDQPVSLKIRTMEANVRQHIQIGVATAVTAVALLGGASPASACSEPEADTDLTNSVGTELAEQITCQVGDGNKSITINQTNNITVGGDLDGELNDAIFPLDFD